MKSRTVSVPMAVILGAALVSVVAGRAAVAAGSKKAIDPTADRMLRQMTDFLAGLKSFTVTTFSVDENTLGSGEKIQRTGDSEVFGAVRPVRASDHGRGRRVCRRRPPGHAGERRGRRPTDRPTRRVARHPSARPAAGAVNRNAGPGAR